MFFSAGAFVCPMLLPFAIVVRQPWLVQMDHKSNYFPALLCTQVDETPVEITNWNFWDALLEGVQISWLPLISACLLSCLSGTGAGQSGAPL